MASDGPVSPDSIRGPESVISSQMEPQSAGESHQGRLSRVMGIFKRHKPAEAPRTEEPAKAEALRAESKQEALLNKLHQKNEQLGGFLATEYGDGENKFSILNTRNFTRGNEHPVNGWQYGENVAFDDQLVITPDRNMILRTRLGEYRNDPNFPDRGPVLSRDSKGYLASEVSISLTHRGYETVAMNPNNGASERKAGAGYRHESRQGYGGSQEVYTLNFGQDRSLTFRPLGESDTTVLDSFSPAAAEDAAKTNAARSPYAERVDSLRNNVDISLITNPDTAYVAEIMRKGMESAQKQFGDHQERLAAQKAAEEAAARAAEEQAANAQKLAAEREAQASAAAEQAAAEAEARRAAEAAKPTRADEVAKQQSEAADAMLDILG